MTKDLSELLSSLYGSGGYAFSRYNPALKFGTPLTAAQESRTTLAQVGTRNAGRTIHCIRTDACNAPHSAPCTLRTLKGDSPAPHPAGAPYPYPCYICRYRSPPPHTLQVAAPRTRATSLPVPCTLLPQVSVGGLNDPSACYVYLMPPPGGAPAPVSRPL